MLPPSPLPHRWGEGWGEGPLGTVAAEHADVHGTFLTLRPPQGPNALTFPLFLLENATRRLIGACSHSGRSFSRRTGKTSWPPHPSIAPPHHWRPSLRRLPLKAALRAVLCHHAPGANCNNGGTGSLRGWWLSPATNGFSWRRWARHAAVNGVGFRRRANLTIPAPARTRNSSGDQLYRVFNQHRDPARSRWHRSSAASRVQHRTQR